VRSTRRWVADLGIETGDDRLFDLFCGLGMDQGRRRDGAEEAAGDARTVAEDVAPRCARPEAVPHGAPPRSGPGFPRPGCPSILSAAPQHFASFAVAPVPTFGCCKTVPPTGGVSRPFMPTRPRHPARFCYNAGQAIGSGFMTTIGFATVVMSAWRSRCPRLLAHPLMIVMLRMRPETRGRAAASLRLRRRARRYPSRSAVGRS